MSNVINPLIDCGPFVSKENPGNSVLPGAEKVSILVSKSDLRTDVQLPTVSIRTLSSTDSDSLERKSRISKRTYSDKSFTNRKLSDKRRRSEPFSFLSDDSIQPKSSSGFSVDNQSKDPVLAYFSNWNKLTDVEKLGLPILALNAIIKSPNGLSKQQILPYLYVIKNFKYSDYEPNEEYNQRKRKMKNVFTIGKLLEQIKKETEIKDTKLDSLIKEMTESVPKDRKEPSRALEKLQAIQTSLLTPPLVETEDEEILNTGVVPQENLEIESKKLISDYDANWNTLTGIEKLGLPILALKEIVKHHNGISKKRISTYLSVIKNYNFASDYLLAEEYNSSRFCLKPANVFNIGKLLEQIKIESNLEDDELNILIIEMTNLDRTARIKPNVASEKLQNIQTRLLQAPLESIPDYIAIPDIGLVIQEMPEASQDFYDLGGDIADYPIEQFLADYS